MQLDVMLLPVQDACTELYFHAERDVSCHAGGMRLAGGCVVSFDGYYNLFPIGTYRKYTVCTSPQLVLEARGRGRVRLTACDVQGNVLLEESTSVNAENFCKVTMHPEIPEQAAAVFWSFSAETDCELRSAVLTANAPMQREIRLAAGICTYHREPFIQCNAAAVSGYLQRIGASSHHLLIADNGGTLSGLLPELPHVTTLPNPNTGGSGGFSRIMQEVLQSEAGFTHLLLMDDDIEFRPEILGKLLFFLSHCRAEYAHVTVGGAMSLLDMPWIQFEAGAKFLEGGVLHGLMQGLDLRSRENCIRYAAVEQEADYNSWWCCCMSVEKIRNAGLSMPFFFKMDDVEYALRLGQPVVCLSGVCVAHEDFVKKYNPAIEYYNTRNTLITAALHDRTGGRLRTIRNLVSAVCRNVFLQRYETAGLILRAYGDFLKGADFLRNTDASALHREIMRCVPECESIPEGTELTPPVPVPSLLRMLTLGGILLPCSRDTAAVDAFHAYSAEGFRVRELLHCYPMTGRMYRTHLQRGRALRLLLRMLTSAAVLLFRREWAVRSFREASGTLCSTEYWEKVNRFRENDAV